jgi:hydrogenase maturation protease
MNVIGIGSPFGDDRAGWCVAETLAGAARPAAHGQRLAVTICRAPGAELPALLGEAEVAIVVDAVAGGGAPGTVYRLSGRHLPPPAGAGLSCHGMGLQTLLELAEALGRFPSTLIVYGIEAETVEPHRAMSDSVWRAVARVAEDIKRDIAHFLGR